MKYAKDTKQKEAEMHMPTELNIARDVMFISSGMEYSVPAAMPD